MSKRLNQSYKSVQTNKIAIRETPETGIVTEVILDDTHKLIRSKEDSTKSIYTEKETGIVGSAVVRPIKDKTSAESSLFTYQPLNNSLLEIPIIGETVELYKIGSIRYYRRISSNNISSGNAAINKNKTTYKKTQKTDGGGDYSTVSKTSTANSSKSDDRSTKYGEYFEEQQVNKLKLYEGDSILQSRFGQSIRFSGYNNSESTFSPTTIIRNRQNDESVNNLKRGDITEEDVNKDGSIIALTSQDYKMPFQPGLVDDGGSSNFETNPLYAKIPEEYVGQDQILINSERIIISSKAAETMFFSKGNYSIISDGDLSMDFGFGGAKLDFGDEVWLTTDKNSANIWVNTGDGQIRLNTDSTGKSIGSGQKEPLARGQTLVDILDAMINAISNQIYATPAGPTAKGPLNLPEFEQIRARLDQIKSTLNFTE